MLKAKDFIYYDLQKGRSSDDISLLFPKWRPGDERMAVLCPHDDDGILGAGYAILAALANDAEVHICIFCDGRAGYSQPEERDTIVERRREETTAAYKVLGVPARNIVRFAYPDFSLLGWLGWLLPDGRQGTMSRVVPTLRWLGITRLLLPNGYREHIDHEAAFRAGAYDGPQVGDAVLADWGTAEPVRSTAIYAVWSDFSPEDALVEGRAPDLRANRVISAPVEAEELVSKALGHYISQKRIIEGLLAARKGRRQGSRAIEAYLAFDPRPPLDYAPYHKAIAKIDRKQKA